MTASTGTGSRHVYLFTPLTAIVFFHSAKNESSVAHCGRRTIKWQQQRLLAQHLEQRAAPELVRILNFDLRGAAGDTQTVRG